MTLGQFIRNWRVHDVLQMGMREFCLSRGIRSDRWMVIERDFAKPNNFEALTRVLEIDEKMDSFVQLQNLYFAHEPRTMTEDEMDGMMPAFHPLSGDQWLALRNQLQNQIHLAIIGAHPI